MIDYWQRSRRTNELCYTFMVVPHFQLELLQGGKTMEHHGADLVQAVVAECLPNWAPVLSLVVGIVHGPAHPNRA